ncbi:MAG: hypothetical protein ACRD0H_32100 [Actinomycetes bacterium]
MLCLAGVVVWGITWLALAVVALITAVCAWVGQHWAYLAFMTVLFLVVLGYVRGGGGGGCGGMHCGGCGR